MPTVSVKNAQTTENTTPTERSFEVNEGELMFDGLDRQGCTLPHGCLAGSCGSCRVEILEGVENISSPSAIERNTIEALIAEYNQKYGEDRVKGKTIRLSCRTKVNGNVVIEALKS